MRNFIGRQVKFNTFLNKNEYETFNFIKPTALGRRFISGESYHPLHVFKGIIGGEAKRLRRLNSTDEGWHASLENLRDKCKRSNFNKEIIEDMLDKVKKEDKGQTEALKLSEPKDDMKNIPWASSIPTKQLKITEKHHNLLQNDARLQPVYKRPPSIKDQLPACRYRKIANPPPPIQGTQPCGNCKLCGKRGATTSMIKTTDTATTFSRTGKKFQLKSTLTCKNYGIYQLRCRKCMEKGNANVGTYVGMTSDRFHKRFNGHRSNFNFNIQDNSSDNYALAGHYKKCHNVNKTQDLPSMEQAYELVFLEEPDPAKIRQCEDKWKHNLEADINVQKMITANIQ